MQNHFSHVCSSIKIGSMEVPNRIVLPPMGTNFAEVGGGAGDRLIRYYEARAEGGAGLICVEGASVTEMAGTGVVAELAIEDGRFIPGLRDLTEAVHAHGSKISLQIHHPGRQALRIANRGQNPVAPSPIPCPVVSQMDPGVIPRELTIEEIEMLEDQFSHAALRAQLAGFDAVELHGAHGYLFTQFMSPLTNRRQDAYGGSFDKRMRFSLEVVRKIRALAPQFPIIFRLSAEEGVEGGITVEMTKQIGAALEKGGVDALSISSGFYPTLEKILPPIYYPKGWLIQAAAEIKQAVSIPVIGVSRIPTLDLAEEILSDGKVDLVGMGRALIADPHLVKKGLAGREHEIRRCIYCNFCAMDRILSFARLKCAVNTRVGMEYRHRENQSPVSKKVLVIGGGPGGLEAARVAAERGHTVKLMEADSELGGQLRAAAGPSFKQEIRGYIDYLVFQVRKAGVTVELNKRAEITDILSWSPDAVVLATGAVPWVPEIPGNEKAALAVNVLNGKEGTEHEVIIAGAGYVGCETALHLAEQGKNVTLMEMLGEIGSDVGVYEKKVLESKIREMGINVVTNRKMVEVVEGGILASDESGNNEKYSCDTVVMALGVRPRRDLAEALKDKLPEVYEVGDCIIPGRVHAAVHRAAFVAERI